MASDAPPPHHPNIFTEELDDDDDDENDAVAHHLRLLNPNPTIMTNNNNNPDSNIPRNVADEDDDVDVDDDDVDDDSTSSTDPPIVHHHHHRPPMFTPPPLPTSTTSADSSAANLVTVAVPVLDQRLNDFAISTNSTTTASATLVEEKKPPFPIDESRKLFQRLWTDEDEIELLQGFLDYTTQRGSTSQHHHDTTAFYDQIKSKLQLDFNKSQLVEKLRRLKKKYRNVVQKIGSGKEYVFKSPHDQATFEISKKIWSGSTSTGNSNNNFNANCSSAVKISHSADEGGLNLNDDDDRSPNPYPNPNINFSSVVTDYSPNPNGADVKIPIRSRKRPRGASVGGGAPFGGVVNIASPQYNRSQTPVSIGVGNQTRPATAMPNVIEETVRSCLSPLFKELLNGVMNLSNGSRGVGGLATLSTMPLGLGFGGVDFAATGDERRWRKQQILELEVLSRRLELVQDQIKVQLEELKGKDTSSQR